MDPWRILFVLRLPGRLTVQEVAILLNFHVDAVRHLVKLGLLEAIGQTTDVELMFDAVYIDALRRDAKWLRKATDATRAHNRKRNEAQAAQRIAKSKKQIE
jgi:hypothetical protein